MLAIIGCGLAGLAALGHGGGAMAQNTTNVISEDAHFYGLSPAVDPPIQSEGLATWADAWTKASNLVQAMTLEEKVNLTGGVTADNSCSGNIQAIPRLGFAGMCVSDAGNGLRATDFVNSYPSGLHVGASWNRNLTYERGSKMGGEFKTKGVNMLLGPVVGPIGRVVKSGRNWEGVSVDPYLSGILVADTVKGVQDAGVIASTKHFIGNEQETNRNPIDDVRSTSSNIDDRTIHELYLWPFQDAVKAGTGNIMCSYQRLNNSYGCQNSKSLNGLLKTELGFQGFVVSDWGAQHGGYSTAWAGLDVAMASGSGFFEGYLVEAVNNGSIPESRVTDMATRILASWFQLGQDEDFPEPGVGMPSDIVAPHEIIDARTPEALPVLFQGAVEGMVLVKNVKNALPLKKPRLLSIFGYSAKSTDVQQPNGAGFYDPWMFGAQPIDVGEIVAAFITNDEDYKYSTVAFNGTIISGGGSGATAANNAVSPLEALKVRAYKDGTAVYWDTKNAEPGVHPASDVCLVIVNAWASEGYDRPSIRDDYTDGLIISVADRCNNTVVVIQNAGVRLVDQFVDHPNVTAIIYAHVGGQDSGPALAALLYGDEVPSGKLPYTVAKNESDYGELLNPIQPEGEYKLFPQSDFTEGVFIDYKHFDAYNITPRYAFGYGLSYTTFEYADLAVAAVSGTNTAELPTGAIVEGGQEDLWDVLVTATVSVSNTGDVDGKEVAQLYVGIPRNGDEAKTPVKQLRGFDKQLIAAGESATFEFELTRRDLSFWDVDAQKWRLRRGEYTVWAGSDSGNLPLKKTFSI
jgi:beta-glucosidase